MADKFLVIDGSSLIHRAFFALPPLTTQSGVHTGCAYGCCVRFLQYAFAPAGGRTAQVAGGSV